MEGWGLIGFQLTLTDGENISCTFTINSEKRANNWSDISSDLGSPSLRIWSLIIQPSPVLP